MDDDLTSRLRDLGRQPVPPGTSAAHLTAMAALGPGASRSPRRFGRLAVGLAAITGFLVGGSGLAMAGALPGPVQEGAADVLAQVGVDAPDGHRNRGSCVSAVARAQGRDDEAAPGAAPAEEERTATERAAAEQAKDACPKGGRGRGAAGDGCRGKPVEGETCVRGPGASRPESVPARPTPPGLEGAPGGCGGPPPWAGGRLSKQEKRDAQAARAAACGTDDPADEPEPGPRAEPGTGGPGDEPQPGREVEPGTGGTEPGPQVGPGTGVPGPGSQVGPGSGTEPGPGPRVQPGAGGTGDEPGPGPQVQPGGGGTEDEPQVGPGSGGTEGGAEPGPQVEPGGGGTEGGAEPGRREVGPGPAGPGGEPGS